MNMEKLNTVEHCSIDLPYNEALEILQNSVASSPKATAEKLLADSYRSESSAEAIKRARTQLHYLARRANAIVTYLHALEKLEKS